MPKLSVPDRKMLDVIEILKQKGTISFRQEFMDAIKMQKQNYRQVKLGVQHFTAVHIMRACKKFDINANWIMGLSEDLFVSQGKLKPISAARPVNKNVNRKARNAG